MKTEVRLTYNHPCSLALVHTDAAEKNSIILLRAVSVILESDSSQILCIVMVSNC